MILDHVDMLELSDEQCAKHNNKLYTLRNLTLGLQHLYRQVDKVEQVLARQCQGKRRVAWGNVPGVPEETRALITCAFHWYAVSACNYVWLVGWLARQADSNRRKPQKYAHDVIPAIVTYRHKIAAHLAALDPEDDTPADIMSTEMFPLTWTEDRFQVGGWNVTIRKEGQTFQNKHDFQWSLTEMHAQLAKRYWPESIQEYPTTQY